MKGTSARNLRMDLAHLLFNRVTIGLFLISGWILACKRFGLSSALRLTLMASLVGGALFLFGLNGPLLLAIGASILQIPLPFPTWSMDFFLGVVFLLLFLPKIGTKSLEWIKPSIPILVFLGIVFLNYLRIGVDFPFTDIGEVNFAVFLSFLGTIVIYLTSPSLFISDRKVKQLYWVLALTYAFLLLDSWGRYLGVWEGLIQLRGQAGSAIEHMAQSGTYIRFGQLGAAAWGLFPLVLVFFRPRNPRQRTMKFIMITPLLFSILISGWRSCLAAAFLLLGIYALMTVRAKKVASALIAVSLLFTILQSFGLSPMNTIFNLNPRIFDPHYLQESMGSFQRMEQGRLPTWYLSWKIATGNPLVGKGPPTRLEASTYLGTDAIWHAYQGTHATYLNIMAIHGFPALILYIVGLIVLLKKVTISLKNSNGYSFQYQNSLFLLLWFSGTMFLFLWGGSHWGGNWMTYLFFGLIGRTFYLSRRDQNSDRLDS